MFPPKNPDLRPESMWNYELAFAQRLLDGRLSYGINVFYIDGKNLIVAVPRAGATPLNMNTGKIDNTGVEVEAAYRIHPHWSVETNYSYLHMDNPVLGAPEHKFYAGAMFSKNRWTVSTGLQYVANLYTNVDHVQTEDFILWNINGSFKVTEWFDVMGTWRKPLGTTIRNKCWIPHAQSYNHGRYKRKILISFIHTHI